ncbi:MAG TPA: hypothetical protein VJ123_00605 [Anaerolineales bacterium]|nr:hypothetical protein [Anaerolineales bacterium]
MDAPTDWILWLAGLMLRFGAPLGLTALAVWILRRVDAHWQGQATRRQTRPTTPALGMELRCWVISQCSEVMRRDCPILWEGFGAMLGRIRSPGWPTCRALVDPSRTSETARVLPERTADAATR